MAGGGPAADVCADVTSAHAQLPNTAPAPSVLGSPSIRPPENLSRDSGGIPQSGVHVPGMMGPARGAARHAKRREQHGERLGRQGQQRQATRHAQDQTISRLHVKQASPWRVCIAVMRAGGNRTKAGGWRHAVAPVGAARAASGRRHQSLCPPAAIVHCLLPSLSITAGSSRRRLLGGDGCCSPPLASSARP